MFIHQLILQFFTIDNINPYNDLIWEVSVNLIFTFSLFPYFRNEILQLLIDLWIVITAFIVRCHIIISLL